MDSKAGVKLEDLPARKHAFKSYSPYKAYEIAPHLVATAIRNWYIKGHEQFFIYGKKSAGKSRYCLQNGQMIGEALFDNWTWEDTLKLCIFDREQLTRILRDCYFRVDKNGAKVQDIDETTGKPIIQYRLPFLIMDDFGAHNQSTKKYDEYLDELSRTFQVLRRLVNVVILNAPNFKVLANKLKAGDWDIIRITKHDGDRMRARFYRYSESPTGTFFFPLKHMGGQFDGLQKNEYFYYNNIPPEVIKKYEAMSDSYAWDMLNRLDMARRVEEIKTKSELYLAKETAKALKNARKGEERKTFRQEFAKAQAKKIKEARADLSGEK